MRNPRTDLIKSFGAALSGLQYNGQDIPVYATSPQKAPATIYIQIGTVNTTQFGCKDAFGHTGSVDIQVIDNRKGNFTSLKDVEGVSDLILAALTPTTTSVLPMNQFNMVYLVLSNSFNDVQLFDASYSPRNILQYSFEVNEKVDVSRWILADGNWNDNGIWIDNATWNDGTT